MVELGVRIELYERVSGPGVDSEGYLGAILRDDGYEGVSTPAVGDFIALGSVRAGEVGEGPMLRGDGAGPFLRVRRVEHHLRSVHDDGAASRAAEPVAILVLHSPVGVGPFPSDDPTIAELLGLYDADGWNLSIGSDSPLYPAYRAATAE